MEYSLTNVWMRDKGKWKHVTPEEESLGEETIRVRSEILWCRYCNKPVTKTKDGKKGAHFKHSRGDDDKECPDRSIPENQSGPEYSVKEKILPLRLQRGNEIRLELGLLPIPENLRNSEQFEIECREENICRETLRVNYERLSTERITWFGVGKPCVEYKIEGKTDILRWPRMIDGVREWGLFDGWTRRLLSAGSDVRIGEKYFFLTREKQPEISRLKNIKKERRCEKDGWQLWEFWVPQFGDEANRFFMEHGFWLTESPLTLYPIWPIFVEQDDIVKFQTSQLYWFVQKEEQIKCKLFPSNNELAPKGSLLITKTRDKNQMLAMGRYSGQTLKYVYLSCQGIGFCKENKPEISVRDKDGKELASGKYFNIPKDGSLRVSTKWDGKICVWCNGKKIREARLKGETSLQIDLGERIEIFQGLDRVWEAEFVRKEPAKISKTVSDVELLRRLRCCRGNPTKISCLVRLIAERLEARPLLKRWLTQQIREGQIDEKAWKILKKEFEKGVNDE